MHKLYDIIIPRLEPQDPTSEMYFRVSENCQAQVCEGGLQLRPLGEGPAVVSFDTYFNAFSAAKWLQYTRLTNLALSLKVRGSCLVSLCAVDADDNESELARYAIGHEPEQRAGGMGAAEIAPARPRFADAAEAGTVVLPFPMPAQSGLGVKYSPVLFFWKIMPAGSGEITNQEPGCLVESAAYVTEISPDKVRDVNLSICICTYRRERYVLNTLQAVRQAILDNTGLEGKIQVRLVDNGQSLDKSLNSELFAQPWLHLYSNLNTGGSGGFARGMLETLEDVERGGQPATHVLLMDDDIELPVGVLEKTFSLLRLIKDEYLGAFVGGAMLDIDARNIQVVGAETYDGWFLLKKRHGELNVVRRAELITNEVGGGDTCQHQAWWYCVIPLEVIWKNGLPYPFFFQFDDVEYSMRTGCSVISLNGLAVWHEPFHKKIQNSKEFFRVRNGLVLCAVRKDHSLPMLMHILRRVAVAVLINNYKGIDAITQGFYGFMSGLEQFRQAESCQMILRELLNYNDQEVCLKDRLISDIDMTAPPEAGTWQKLVSLLTINGHLLPDFLLKEGLSGTDIRKGMAGLLNRRTAVIVNSDKRSGFVYKQSLRLLLASLFAYFTAMLRYLLRRNRLNKLYRAKYAEMTGMKFWRAYLELPR